MELLMVEKSPKIKELSQDKNVENLNVQVVEETSKEETCRIMNEKSIGIKEKERVENKERLFEQSCIFDSNSIFSRESDHLECSKEKKSELEKSGRINKNECFIEKQESEKEEQREKEIVVLEKSEKVNIYANETNSFLTSESLYVQNFEDPSKDEDEKLAYKSIKTINFFSSNSYLSFEIYFEEIKVVEYYDNVPNWASCMLGIEDEERSMEEDLGTILEDLSTSLSLNPYLSCYQRPREEFQKDEAGDEDNLDVDEHGYEIGVKNTSVVIMEFQKDEAGDEDNLDVEEHGYRNRGEEYFGGHYGSQQEDKVLEKIKCKVPTFHGDSDPNVFLDWERKVENLFNTFQKFQSISILTVLLDLTPGLESSKNSCISLVISKRGEEYFDGHYGSQQEDKALEKVKCKVPSIHGDSDPNMFLNWERKVENLFNLRNYSEHLKAKSAITKFSGYILHW
ncbi:hypothetical protein M9H77_30313 [Catharanthus roseus]|uniref:Uncharacterized protein n=1 Tax=Catharanthus roseus TaxID=4058 RepID=A0ACB9ZX94_CATRO|nr:hypothetical protein M9H77_30313 [Catharanthus roseus]